MALCVRDVHDRRAYIICNMRAHMHTHTFSAPFPQKIVQIRMFQRKNKNKSRENCTDRVRARVCTFMFTHSSDRIENVFLLKVFGMPSITAIFAEIYVDCLDLCFNFHLLRQLHSKQFRCEKCIVPARLSDYSGFSHSRREKCCLVHLSSLGWARTTGEGRKKCWMSAALILPVFWLTWSWYR